MQTLLGAPGINANQANDIGWTALMWAARNGHTEAAQALLQAPGVNINQADSEGCTALILAALHGHTAVVQAFHAATVANRTRKRQKI